MDAKAAGVWSRNINPAKHSLITSIKISTGSGKDWPGIGIKDENDEANHSVSVKTVVYEQSLI